MKCGFLSVSCFESVPELSLWQQQGRSSGGEPCGRWRRWGVEAIIGEGWRGHVLCTFSLLGCSRDRVPVFRWSLLCTLHVNSLNLPHTYPHAYSHTRTCKHKHTRYDVPSTLTCIYWKRTGDRALHLSELRICQIFPIFGAATFFLTSLLPPCRPSSERHQAAIATGRLWETEIRSLQTRGSRN